MLHNLHWHRQTDRQGRLEGRKGGREGGSEGKETREEGGRGMRERVTAVKKLQCTRKLPYGRDLNNTNQLS